MFIAASISLVVLLVANVAGAEEPPQYLLEWGTSGTGDGQFNRPIGISVGPDGNVYVTENANPRVQKFTPEGAFLGTWGSAGSGDGQFIQARGCTFDALGNVYVVDVAENIQVFTSTGVFLFRWGSFGTGNGQFDTPLGGIDHDSQGNIYVADTYNNRVQKFTALGVYLDQWPIVGPNSEVVYPVGLAIDGNDHVFVGDQNVRYIQEFTSAGVFVQRWGPICSANGIAIDQDDDIYVTCGAGRIEKYTRDGTLLTMWGSSGSGEGEFSYPYAVAVDGVGAIYVADLYNDRIQKFIEMAIPVRTASWSQIKSRYE